MTTTVPDLRTQMETWLELLRHTLGAGPEVPQRKKGFRNRFCAGVDSPDHRQFLAMVDNGLATAGPFINKGESQYFFGNEAACRLVGLNRKQTRRAIEAN